MYNSQYYTCEQIDQRLLQGYLDDYNTQTGHSLTKEQFLTKLGNVFAKETVIDNTAVNIGYFICDTAAGTAAKAITAVGYTLFAGGSMKVKFLNRNTAGSATLNINSQGAKTLYYGGKAVSASNSWDNNEIVEIYYDGTSYYANNVEGNFKDGIFDISAYNLTEGQPTKYATLAEALGTNGANVPAIFRKGGMQIKYVSTSDNKYVQYRLMSDSFNTTVANWQGVDDEPTAGSDNLIKSGAVFNDMDDINSNIEDLHLISKINGYYINLGDSVSVGSVVNVTPIVNSNYKYSLISVNQGDVIILNGSGGNDSRLYGILDSTYHLLEKADARKTEENKRMVMPTNAAYFVINTGTNVDSYVTRKDSVYQLAKYGAFGVNAVSVSSVVNKIIRNLFIGKTTYSGDVHNLKVRFIARSGNNVTIRLYDPILNDQYSAGGAAPSFEFTRDEGFYGVAIVDINNIADGATVQCYDAELNNCVFDKNIAASLMAYSVKDKSIGIEGLNDTTAKKLLYAVNTVIGVSESEIANKSIKNMFIQNNSYSGNVKDLKISWIQRDGSNVIIRLRDTTLNEDYNISGAAPYFEFTRDEGFSGCAIVDINTLTDGVQVDCNKAKLNDNVFDKNIGASLLALFVANRSIGPDSLSDDISAKVNSVTPISNNKNANKYIKNIFIQDNYYSGNIRDLKVSWIQRADNVVTIRLRNTTLNVDYNIGGNAPLFEFSRNEGFSGVVIIDISELPNNTQIDCNKATLNSCVFDKSIKAALLAYSVRIGSVGYDSLADALKKILGSSTDYIGYESITNFVTGKYIEIGSTIGATISLTPISNSSWEYQIINVSPNEKYIIRANGGNGPKAYGIIDAENKLLEYSLAADKIENKSQIIIPANGAKLIVNSRQSFLSYVLKIVDEVPFLYNPWFRKKVAVLGASHTAAANSWADHAAKMLGFNLYKRAIGGSGVLSSNAYCAILPDGTYVARVGNPSSITSLADLRTYMQGRGYNATEFTDCTYTEYRENPTGYNVTDTDWFVIASKGNAEDRIHTLPQDSDIVVIQFGANDTGQIKGYTNPSGMEMGNVDDYDVSLTDTYYANYKNMLQKIMAWCTNIKRIIILIPDDSTACYVSNTDMTRTDWGKDHDAVKDAIRNLALVYGYEKVEFKNILNYFTVYTLTSDGTHPTAECQKILGEYFANNALNKL